MNLKKINSKLAQLNAKKTAVEAKKAAAIAQYDAEIADYQAQINDLEKVKRQLEKLQKAQEALLADAADMMDKKPSEDTGAAPEESAPTQNEPDETESANASEPEEHGESTSEDAMPDSDKRGFFGF